MKPLIESIWFIIYPSQRISNVGRVNDWTHPTLAFIS